MVHRVIALQRRRSTTSPASTAGFRGLDGDENPRPSADHRGIRATEVSREVSTPRRLAQHIASLVSWRAPVDQRRVKQLAKAGTSMYAPAFAPPTPDVPVRPVRAQRPPVPRPNLRLEAAKLHGSLEEEDGEDRADTSAGSNTSRRGKRRSGSGKVWSIIDRFEDEEDRREEESVRVETLSRVGSRKRSARADGMTAEVKRSKYERIC